ncbi:MAG: DNA translocase FtsK 4TM domain-containing protein [Candidatus Omnitrophota bacterium]|nr:MAG: DNA translocase FtsK 4TM domain-containing protein [Candidatus Omnitrophota bacterium]
MKNLSSFLKSIVFFFLSALIFLSLISFSPQDIPFLSSPSSARISNLIGITGAYFAYFFFFAFGYAAYFFPFYLFFLGWDRLKILRFFGLGRNKVINAVSFCFFLVFLSSFLGLFSQQDAALFKSSGMVGFFLTGFFQRYLGIHGTFITLFLLLTVNALLLFGYFFVDVFLAVKFLAVKLAYFLKTTWQRIWEKKASSSKSVSTKPLKPRKMFAARHKEVDKKTKPQIKIYTPKVDKNIGVEVPETVTQGKQVNKEEAKKKLAALESQPRKQFDSTTYHLPSVEILKVPRFADSQEIKEDIKINIRNLEETLTEFGVEAKVVSVQKGPVVTMYELQPQAGVKIQKISTLADDIALSMKSSSVRIVAPIPGRGTVGVEIPNEKKNLVSLREVLEEPAFINLDSKLSLVIGKDVSGNPVVADLNEMPHLLIAGATGSGKTVCVNSLISSILFKAKPDEVKFILIDPKMVELASFGGIPHLIHPIISEARKTFVALNWAVEEMEKRYRLLADAGARNIDIYNNVKGSEKMPYIIIIVDELADLMIVARESIETSIQRLAQLSRAVGIHLILATQRPSVDVITGVIKANFPARISFKVSSKVDSRTVLDAMGADKLLGRGDLLFLKPGAVKLIRAQGAFIDDEDIGNLTDFVRAQGGPVYEESIIEGEKKQKLGVRQDELFDEAIKTVLEARQASASILQRRLRVGYTRAARLLDLMEASGIVGPFCGSKAREILVDPEEFLAERDAL